MPRAFMAKVTKSTNRPKLCTLLPINFYWVVIFSKQQHCTPQIKCGLNINPASSSKPNARSKDIGHSGVSNMMLTRLKQSRLVKTMVSWSTPACLKGEVTIQL